MLRISYFHVNGTVLLSGTVNVASITSRCSRRARGPSPNPILRRRNVARTRVRGGGNRILGTHAPSRFPNVQTIHCVVCALPNTAICESENTCPGVFAHKAEQKPMLRKANVKTFNDSVLCETYRTQTLPSLGEQTCP